MFYKRVTAAWQPSSLHRLVERSRFAAWGTRWLASWRVSLYKASHVAASFLFKVLVATGTKIEYKPHVFWMGLRGFVWFSRSLKRLRSTLECK
jgi:hypothetical protein